MPKLKIIERNFHFLVVFFILFSGNTFVNAQSKTNSKGIDSFTKKSRDDAKVNQIIENSSKISTRNENKSTTKTSKVAAKDGTSTYELVDSRMNSSKISSFITIDSVMVQRSVTLADLLNGQLSGVKATVTDGAPGGAVDLLIRGISSVRGSSQPLILLDGVMLNNSQLDVQNPWADIDGVDYQAVQHLLWGINSNDIESIEVLKNTASTALYGSAGANGVIKIKTKVGDKFDKVIRWSSNVSISNPAKKLEFLSPDNYRSYYQTLSGQTFDMTNRTPMDWQKEAFVPSVSSNHNLSLSGTTQGTSYLLSLNYKSLNGIVPGTNVQDIGFRTNLEQRISPTMQLGVSFVLDRNTTNSTQSTYLLGGSSLTSQISAIPFTNSGENIQSWLDDYEDTSNSWRIIPQVYTNLFVFPGLLNKDLKLNIKGGVDYVRKDRVRWLGTGIDRGASDNGRAGRSEMVAIQYNADASFAYTKLLTKGLLLKTSVGGSFYGTQNVNTMIKGYNYFLSTLKGEGITWGNGILGKSDRPIYSKMIYSNGALWGDMSLEINNSIELNGGLRGDYMLNYDSEIQYYPFANAKWNVSSERLWKDNVSSTGISSLAFKAGWGNSGKNDFTPYSTIEKFTLGQSTIWVPYESQIFYFGRIKSSLQEFNIGADMGFLKDRIHLNLQFYKGQSTDMLSVYNFTPAVKMKDSIGNSYMYTPDKLHAQNRIKMDKWGLEAELMATLYKTKDIEWTLSANISIDRMKITDSGIASSSTLGSTGAAGFKGSSLGIYNADDVYVSAFLNGQAPNVFYGYQTRGILGPEHVALTPPLKGDRLQAGDIKFVDTNKDGQVDENDKVVIGNPNPDFVFGINSAFKWKRLSVQIRMDGSYGNDVLNLNLLQQNNVSQTGNVRATAYENAWSVQQPTHIYPRIGALGLNEISDLLVEDGSFIRLSNLSLSYEIPLQKIKWIESLNLNLMASNLFVLTRYRGFDPDVNSFAGNWSLRGVDLGSYPKSQMVSIGFSAQF
jgi:TonB-linked SusC/RagA family outer membrane protein